MKKELHQYCIHKINSQTLQENGMLKSCNPEACSEQNNKYAEIKKQVEKVNEQVHKVKEEKKNLLNENSELKDSLLKANVKKDSLSLQVVSSLHINFYSKN